MKFEMLFSELEKSNCYSLISKIFGGNKKLIDSLLHHCNLHNYKINKGNLNLKGLTTFICLLSDEDMKIFNNYFENLCK